MNVSVPTLAAMEKGDPRVSMGVYATALWLMGRDDALRDLAAPENDVQALVREISAIPPDRQRIMTRARKREAALFAFLAEQAVAPDEERLLSPALDETDREQLGFLMLLLAITAERHASRDVLTKLNDIAAKLLGPQLNNEDYGRWLRSGRVDVGRLTRHLDQVFMARSSPK